MIGPRITGTSRFFNSAATFHDSVPPLMIGFTFKSSASLSAAKISVLRSAVNTTGFSPRT